MLLDSARSCLRACSGSSVAHAKTPPKNSDPHRAGLKNATRIELEIIPKNSVTHRAGRCTLPRMETVFVAVVLLAFMWPVAALAHHRGLLRGRTERLHGRVDRGR